MIRLSRGFYLTLLTSILWATLIILNKYQFNLKENEFNLLFWTNVLSLPYWLYALNGVKGEVRKINKKAIIILILTGLISSFGVKVAEMFAVKNTQAINFSFLVRTVIIFTIIFEFIILKKKITKGKIIMSIMILIGIYLLVSKGEVISFTSGDIITIFEAMLIALGNNVLGKYATNLMSVKLSTAGNYFFGFIPITILCLVFGKIGMPVNILLILASTLVLTVMTIVRYQALKETSASFLTMVISFTPLWVTIMAVLFLGESINFIQMIGGVFIMSSILIVEKLKIK